MDNAQIEQGFRSALDDNFLMYTHNKWIYKGFDQSKKIWRYTSLENLIGILQGKMWLSARNTFSDRHEIGEYVSDFIKVCYADSIDKRRREFYRRTKQRVRYAGELGTSCWTMAEKEVFPMWKAYSSDKYSVRIQSSVGALLDSLNLKDEQAIYCGPMFYGEEKNCTKEMDILFHKTIEYEIEREFRFYLFPPQKKGTNVRIRPSSAIEQVTLSPFLNPDLSIHITNFLLNQFPFLEMKVSRSEMIEY